jgi:hypothetical protein
MSEIAALLSKTGAESAAELSSCIKTLIVPAQYANVTMSCHFDMQVPCHPEDAVTLSESGKASQHAV